MKRLLSRVRSLWRRPVAAVAAVTPPKGPIEDRLVHAYFRERNGGTMVDVGAHHGSSALPFLRKDWTVVAFEPDPSKHERLRKLGGPPKLRLHTCAVSDAPQDGVPFFTSTESTGIASLLAFRDSHTEALRVPVRTLRDVLAEEGLDRIDYLKVDAEGYDLFVLRGFPWDRFGPELVMCEFELNKTEKLGYTTQELGDFLVAQGYAVFMSEWYPIVKYGGQHTWRSIRRYPCACADERGWGNFLAAKLGVADKAFARIVRDHAT